MGNASVLLYVLWQVPQRCNSMVYISSTAVICLDAAQVRQKLYTTAIGKWRNYEEHLQPIVSDLHEYVEKYESEYGRGQTRDEL